MRILIVEVNWLGDVLFSTPAIKVLKRKFPESFIACLVVPRTKEILEGNPNIDELIINDEDYLHRGFFGKVRLARELRNKKFDLCLLFHRSATRAAIAWLAGIPRRIGYGRFKNRIFLSQGLSMPKKDSLHRIDYYLNICASLGCGREDRFYEFFTAKEDEAFIDNFLRKEGIVSGDSVVCLNPAGNWEPKRWPKENFAQLADALIRDFGAKVIFTGANRDLELILEIKKNMSYSPIISAGRINLKQLACLFKKAGLVISGDSGPLHIASSQGANVIALFGPTSQAITCPQGKGRIRIIQKCSPCPVPCYDKKCHDNTCMRNITVSDVISEVRGFGR